MKTDAAPIREAHLHAEPLSRLAKIEGHVRSIRSMIEGDRECDQVLTQIAAVKAALDQVAKLILHEHMRTCLQTAVKQGRGDKALLDLEAAVNRFIR